MIKSGVYALMHVPSGQAYIGSAKNMVNRFGNHKFHLRNNTHANAALQALWNLSGGEHEWVFCFLPSPPEARLLHKQEQHWMDNWPGQVLNIHPKAGSALGHKMSDETKAKQSVSAKKVAADPAERKRRSERAKKQHKAGKLGRKAKHG